jgi:hypothetical protein
MGKDDISKTERGNSTKIRDNLLVFFRGYFQVMRLTDKLDYMGEASLEEFFLEEDESTLTLNARKHSFSFVFKVLKKERTN